MPRTNLDKVAQRTLLRAKIAENRMKFKVMIAATTTAESLVKDTPVDTAEARSNWTGSIGSPSSDERSPYFPYPSQPSAANLPKRAETANATAALAQIVGAWRTHRLGRRLFLTNNVDYIRKLNAGISPQTRPGFLERAIIRGRAVARRVG